ncbi:hypothetical protein DPEC_G00329840 [Dallia pectoralis]|uniref:Uncharacterized protein n=1 Tax=Dallia pectoralis TaxID=75939 RepID=A0ACC2F8S9_DALPE|nr:hypothetical protein DPEC_G00329840 [Dallia pectoralis]
MALPAGKSVGAAANNLYEELGDSAMSKRCVLEDGDRQRLIGTFATRAIAAHKQSGANGILVNKMPKSESNVTLFSDENPLTTKNPLFEESTVTLGSPETLGKDQRRTDPLGTHSHPRGASFLRFNPGGSGHSWTLPTRLHRKEMYDALRRQVVMDPVQWELELLKTELKDSKDVLDGLDWGNLGRGVCLEPKPLSVKEQARQFEQQAMREMKQRQSRDSRGSLSPDFLMGFDSPKHQAREDRHSLGSIPGRDSPQSHCQLSGDREGPPRIVISPSDGTPPPSHKPTPPVLRRPVSQRPPPPPLPAEPEPPRKELKGILKNVQNIADIEKSVANMHSRIDKKQMLPQSILKSRGSADSMASPGGVSDVAETANPSPAPAESDCPAAEEIRPVQPIIDMNSIMEELEKRFPSQSTAM